VLHAIDHDGRIDSKEYHARLPEVRIALLEAQAELRERGVAALVLVGGDDRWGCSEVLDRMHEWLDPARIDTVVRRPVTDEEAERPFLWRTWRDLPARGRLGLVFGGWPHRLMLERLRDRIDDASFDRRLGEVRTMDRMLAADGLIIARLWIHAPRAEHQRRADEARRDPEWKWRLDATDRFILDRFEDVLPLGQRVLDGTDTPEAPWHVISSADEHTRDLTAAEFVLQRLESGLAAARVQEAPADATTVAPPSPAITATTTITTTTAPAGRLAELDLEAHLSKSDYHERLETLQLRLGRRMRQFAESGQSAVVVMEGPDAAGKGGAIRRMTDALPATIESVTRTGPPTDEELARHYLWRFWRHLPPAGSLVVFDRSWYGRVLVERVEGYADEAAWRRAYEEINAFEQQLLDHGVALVKFWLHIDRDEQARRFEAREATGWKRHKITEADWRARRKWEDYTAAAEEMFARTSPKAAPWTIVPAVDKRFARIQVLDVVTKTLKRSLWQDRRRARRS
jgi:polyphosphate:AMP phosphotransferase